ncbi:glycosyltransferase family 25 protein [Chelativorans sp. Marseille-P2723]|uniref:glycosyltransferase family 25 protein n=1 Tax=Chelativorans sp. Marseille-P2723 TaxID=2709133 RepID=UPI001570BFBC|nr:glycosyltransferase family 25 protein [Chelativorans sp. Marseille-P2723]
MRAEAFIIHLARASGRAPQVERLKAGLPLPATVVDAVDAQSLGEHERAMVYRPQLHRPHYPFPLRDTEIACFLSHRKAWRMIIERDLDAGLVVEDDVQLEPVFGAVFSLALSNMLRADVVRFPKQSGRERGPAVIGEGGIRLIAPAFPGLGMQAQLVSRAAAERLLAVTEHFDRPVDTTIQMHWLHGLRMLSAVPSGIREVDDELGGSTIQKKGTDLAERLGREFRRARYRLSARALGARKPRPGTS